MTIVEMDERGRILIPKEVRESASIRPRQRFMIRLFNNKALILEKMEGFEKNEMRRDPLIESIRNPAHVSPEKIKKIDLEKIEEEMWSS